MGSGSGIGDEFIVVREFFRGIIKDLDGGAIGVGTEGNPVRAYDFLFRWKPMGRRPRWYPVTVDLRAGTIVVDSDVLRPDMLETGLFDRVRDACARQYASQEAVGAVPHKEVRRTLRRLTREFDRDLRAQRRFAGRLAPHRVRIACGRKKGTPKR